ncbi:hypothetical protein ACPV4B_19745 [Vibrio parahaemolyticus]|nr:hypothetical protein [Vibrio mediterranei]
MDRMINTIGYCMIAGKYSLTLLLAGLTASTGVMATEFLFYGGLVHSE